MTRPKVTTTVHLTQKLANKYYKEAQARGITYSQLIELIISDWFKIQDKKKGKRR